MDKTAIEKMMRIGNLKGISLLSAADVGSYVGSFLRRQEQNYASVDADKLMGLGILLAKAGHEDADRAALDWLAENPTPQRMDIASLFLIGMWTRAYRRHPVAPDKVAALMGVRQTLNLFEDAEVSFLDALCRVVESDAPASIRAKAAQFLQDALDVNSSATTKQGMRDQIERALQAWEKSQAADS